MAKKTEEESFDLYDLKEKNKRKKNESKKKSQTNKKSKKSSRQIEKRKEENTKDERFNFDEEIIIGLKRIDDGKEKVQKSKSKNGKEKKRKMDKPQKQKEQVPKESIEKRKPIEKTLTKEQRIAKQKQKIVFRFIKWTTLLCMIIGAGIYALLSPIFNIKRIEVVGNVKLSKEEIISLSKIELEQNMFSYQTKEVISHIKENAYVDRINVKRKIPDTIELIISERKASFMIAFANAYALVNNQGYILEIVSKEQELPLLEGIKTEQEQIQEGNRLCMEDLQKLSDVLQIMESATSNEINNWISSIDITNTDNYILKLQKHKKIVHLGDTSDLSTKMLWIIEFSEKEKNTQGEIILNIDIDKPIFRRNV